MPDSVRVAMQLQVEAERKKRASILESEGQLFIACYSLLGYFFRKCHVCVLNFQAVIRLYVFVLTYM